MGYCYSARSKLLDNDFAIIRNIGKILQIGDIRGIRTYLAIKSCQVCSRSVRSFYVSSILSRTNFIVNSCVGYQHTLRSGNITITNSSCPCFFIIRLFFIRTVQLRPDIVCSNIGFHAVQFLQLCHVDRIGILSTCSHAIDLTGCICCTNGNGRLLGRPCSCGICGLFIGSSRIIPGDTSCSRCFGSAADGYAALSADFCVVADGYDIGGCRFIVGGIGRTDDDVVLLVRQFVVITEDDVGLVRIYAVTADLVLRADDIVVLAVGQFILEAVDEVVLRRCSFCVGAVLTVHLIADTGDLGHVGFVNVVAATHDHDLTATTLNGVLHSFAKLGWIVDTAQNSCSFLFINGTIGILDRISCTIDDSRIGVSGHVSLTHDAVGHAAECTGLCRILVDVERTIGQSRCTLKTCSNNAGIGTGYSRCNAVTMSENTGSHTAHALSTIIRLIAAVGAYLRKIL